MEQYEIIKMVFCEEWGIMSREDFFRIFRFDLQEQNVKLKPESTTGLEIIDNYVRDNYSDKTRCNCRRKEGENTKCGKDSKCSFRSERRECDPGCSEDGWECLNHDITKGRNKKVALVSRGNGGFGAASREEIFRGQLVCEYVGCIYAQEDNPYKDESVYTAEIVPSEEEAKTVVVESFLFGNISRFFSSSHEPNAELRILKVNNDMRMGIFAIRTIYPKEEVTWFYGTEYHKEVLKGCRCCSLEYCPQVHRHLPEFPASRILSNLEIKVMKKIKKDKKNWRPSTFIRPKSKVNLKELCRIMDETTEKRINAAIQALKKSKRFSTGQGRKKPGNGMALKSLQNNINNNNKLEALSLDEPKSSVSLNPRRKPANGKAIKSPPKKRNSSKSRPLLSRLKRKNRKAIKSSPKDSTARIEASRVVGPRKAFKSLPSVTYIRQKPGAGNAIKSPIKERTLKVEGSSIQEKIPVLTLSDSSSPLSNPDLSHNHENNDMSVSTEACPSDSDSVIILSQEHSLSKGEAKVTSSTVQKTRQLWTIVSSSSTTESSSSSNPDEKSTDSFTLNLKGKNSTAPGPTETGRRNVGPPIKSAVRPMKQLKSTDNDNSSNLTAMQRLSYLVSEKAEQMRCSKNNPPGSSTILCPQKNVQTSGTEKCQPLSSSAANISSTKNLRLQRATRMRATVCTLSSSEDEENEMNENEEPT